MSEQARYDRLAAEYVLGTLRGAARRRFEVMMERDPGLAEQVRRWQETFGAFDLADVPVQPPGRVWRAIQMRLPEQGADAPSDARRAIHGRKRPGKPDSAGFGRWSVAPKRGWQLASLALAACLATALLWPRFLVQGGLDMAPVPITVLAGTQGGAARQIVVSFDARSRKLVLTPLNMQAPAAGHSLELWLIPNGHKPASLGLIGPQASTVVALNDIRLSPDSTLAVSLEPAGGSPSGQPTGAVLYAGKIGAI
jgi:anti-sigma-K factor RskA